MSLKSGHKIVPVTGRKKELNALFTGRSNLVHLEPGSWTFNEGYEKFGNKYYDFKWFEDDVILCTMPKSGTTWLQEILWTLRNNVNLDNPAGKIPLAARSPIIDADSVVEHMEKPEALKKAIEDNFPDYDTSEGLFLKAVEALPRPRLIKTHLGLPLLHQNILDKVKIVYVIRDPRAVCMSYYHHCRLWTYENFKGTLDEFIEAFMESAVLWGPYWSHVGSAWEKRDHPNMCIVFYEQLKKNPRQEYRRIADFLDVKATDDQLDKIIHYTSFAEMKKRDDHIITQDDAKTFMRADIMETNGGFFRKGESNAFKEEMSETQLSKLNSWMEKMCPFKEILENIKQNVK